MRFADLTKNNNKPVEKQPLSYTDLLEKKLKESLEKKNVQFTAMQLALMEGGHSL